MAEERVSVPNIGDSHDVAVVEVLVQPGAKVEREQPLVVLESDKASMEIPSPSAGTVKKLEVKVGDTVSEGSPILVLETEGGAAKAESAPTQKKAAPPQPAKSGNGAPAEAKAPAANGGGRAAAQPQSAKSSGGGASQPSAGGQLEAPLTEVATQQEPQAAKAEAEDEHESQHDADGADDEADEDVGDESDAAGQPRQVRTIPPAQPVSTAPPEPRGELPHASPAIRRFARELGVELAQVRGSGPNGRITKEDVQGFVKQALTTPATNTTTLGVAEAPEIDFTKFGEISVQPLTKIQKLSGKNLHRSWVTIPHVTQHDEADITELEAFRKKLRADQPKLKLTLLAFFMKAIVNVLKQMPRFNSSLDKTGENLVMKKYFHVGVAVDTPNGLVVPVIRDVDKKSLGQLASELEEVSERARARRLTTGDLQGASITISSLGGIGGTAFTPIINPPEVAVLGVSRAQWKPIYENGTFVPRLICPLSLSYDHRVIDGADAARFTKRLTELLGDIRQLLL
jgi:pyruvate dehydrogenase E2 component (dihydrolipoamide acetyltransferase)